MQFMLDHGVATRRGIMCAHLEGAYSECELRFPLPESEAAQRNCILLPLYADMTEIEQGRVVDVFGEACRQSVDSDISLSEHQRDGRCLNRAATT